MKNLIKLTVTILVALFLVSIAATFSHAQTSNEQFNNFVISLGGDYTIKGNTRAVAQYNKENNTTYTTMWEIYTNITPMSDEEFVLPENNKPVKVDSLVSNDIIFTDVLPTNNYIITSIVYIEAGDILSESKKSFRNHNTYIYNETKKIMIPVTAIPNPELVQEIKSPNKLLYFVYNPQMDVVKYEKKVALMKGNWKGMGGKELGSTPKRTDTKFSIPLLYEWNTCRSRREIFFGLIKL